MPTIPRRLKARLREDAPAVLYGCGDIGLLETGGLAVVGSRHVDDALIDYTMAVGATCGPGRTGRSSRAAPRELIRRPCAAPWKQVAGSVACWPTA